MQNSGGQKRCEPKFAPSSIMIIMTKSLLPMDCDGVHTNRCAVACRLDSTDQTNMQFQKMKEIRRSHWCNTSEIRC